MSKQIQKIRISQLAKELGISRSNLMAKVQQYNLEDAERKED